MSPDAEAVLKLALQLSPEDRNFAAQVLWDSVASDPDSSMLIDDELMAEITRRDSQMNAGMVATREEIMATLQKERACSSHSTVESAAN